jgi:hypothetical protein
MPPKMRQSGPPKLLPIFEGDDLQRLEMALEPLPSVQANGWPLEGDAGKPVSVTFLVPRVLADRIQAVCWELRCTTSDLLRGIVWQRLAELGWEFQTPYKAVDDEEGC